MPYLAAAMAGASIANGIYGANKSASSAKQANKVSLLSQAMAQQHEITKMKNAYQWTVADMEKAGINPILGAVNNGAGAGSGAGPAVSGQQSQEGQIFAQGIQSAVAAAQNQMDIANNTQLANTQSAKNIADATKTAKEAGILSKYGEKKALEEINNLNSNTNKIEAEKEKTQEETTKIKGGLFNSIFGNNPSAGSAIAGMAALGIGGGALKMAKGIHSAYKGWKAAKGFGKFLKTIKN